jgi:hypothetical protein
MSGPHRPGYYAEYRKTEKYQQYHQEYMRQYHQEYKLTKKYKDRRKKVAQTIQAVVDAFVNGQKGAVYGQVPCGTYVRSTGSKLNSYCTQIAGRVDENIIIVTTKKYSVSTSSHTNKLKRTLSARGFVPTERFVPVEVKVPGRWGGFGPAWAPSEYEEVQFEIWRVP